MHERLVHYIVVVLVALMLASFPPSIVYAQEYVLPYPGFMPGHPLYKVQNIVDKIQEFYSFGSFAKFKYHLEMADKKLVEAKTLFEYKQYFLAKEAIESYDKHFCLVSKYLKKSQKEGKNISEKEIILGSAIAKHKKILETLKLELPDSFFWNPEKGKPQMIEIKRIIDKAIKQEQECGTG